MSAPLRFVAPTDECELPDAGAVLDAINALAAEIRGLREALGHRPRRIRGADPDTLVQLLAAIAASWGADREFSVSELLAFASALATRRALRDALTTAGADSRRIGLFLRRTAGIPAGGLVLERIGEADGVAVWTVREQTGS